MTDHFDGKRFFNPEIQGRTRGIPDLMKWGVTRKPGKWDKWRHVEPGPPPPARVAAGELRVTFINHSTLLLQSDGVNVLTDPIWSDRAGPLSFTGMKRAHAPGLRFDDLPPIDVVLVSHNHYDHMDMPTLRRLQVAHNPSIVTGLGNDRYLADRGFPRVRGLDWWQSTEVAGLRVHFVPAQHFSVRTGFDRFRTLWGSFVLENAAGNVYFAGDTGWASHFAQIRARFGPMRLAALPIGAYEPRWFMSQMHISPAEAVRAHLLLEAETSVGIHFGTFRLADDAQDQPVEELAKARAEMGVADDRFIVLYQGVSEVVGRAPANAKGF